ncbi:hypothetical protein [Kineococcus sp. SYSU DK005]|uniref:hypothetical protein n=1 Tax=Kineococcus sp. SYSU DK005 TaxID=3383126 RepID=UPI003D7DFD50
MPSAMRTTMAGAAAGAVAAPLLLLSGAQHDPAQHTPAECYLTSTYTYGTDTLRLIPDLDAAQADLTQQAEELTARLSAADAAEARQLRARIHAVRALSRPDAHRSSHGSTAQLSAYDTHGQVIAKATYGPAVQVFLNPTPTDGYLQQSLTFPARPLPGQQGCTTPGS